jgi:hypothetical protein
MATSAPKSTPKADKSEKSQGQTDAKTLELEQSKNQARILNSPWTRLTPSNRNTNHGQKDNKRRAKPSPEQRFAQTANLRFLDLGRT